LVAGAGYASKDGGVAVQFAAGRVRALAADEQHVYSSTVPCCGIQKVLKGEWKAVPVWRDVYPFEMVADASGLYFEWDYNQPPGIMKIDTTQCVEAPPLPQPLCDPPDWLDVRADSRVFTMDDTYFYTVRSKTPVYSDAILRTPRRGGTPDVLSGYVP